MDGVKSRLLVGIGVTGALTGAAAMGGAASFFARKVVTPEPAPMDVTVHGYTTATVTLSEAVDTLAPGRYGLWVGGYDNHARIGQVLGRRDGRVTRELLGVDFGSLSTGPARINGAYYVGPPATSLDIPLREITYATELGPMPAWRMDVPGSTRWAVLVHGRGANRSEGLRAMATLRDAGINALAVMYRNDAGAPRTTDGLYNLGLSEWRDVDRALQYVLDEGATDIQLFGWSMGGATVLQTADRSEHRDRISRLVLDGPVVNWPYVLAYQAGLNRLPSAVSGLGSRLMRGPLHRNVVGLHQPIDLTLTDWVKRHDELRIPTLILHSEDDDFVPIGPSEQLSTLRPDIVRLERFTQAGHCREWNVDPHRWHKLVTAFCSPD